MPGSCLNYIPSTSEQLNYKLGRKHYFWDRMQGNVNFFYLRLVIHLSNETINSKSLMVKNLFPEFTVIQDQFGRLYHSISKNINAEDRGDTGEENDDELLEATQKANADMLLEHITLLHKAANAGDLLSEQLAHAVTSSTNATSNLGGAPDSFAITASPHIQEEIDSVRIPNPASESSMESNLKTTTEQENSSTKTAEMQDLHSVSFAARK